MLVLQPGRLYTWPAVQKARAGEGSGWGGVTILEGVVSGEALVGFGMESGWRS